MDIKLALLMVKFLTVLSISGAKIFLRSNELYKHKVQMLRENFYFSGESLILTRYYQKLLKQTSRRVQSYVRC